MWSANGRSEGGGGEVSREKDWRRAREKSREGDRGVKAIRKLGDAGGSDRGGRKRARERTGSRSERRKWVAFKVPVSGSEGVSAGAEGTRKEVTVGAGRWFSWCWDHFGLRDG